MSSVRDFPTQAALIDAMQAGQRWKSLRSAPADGHPHITVHGGLRVQTTRPAPGDPGAFLSDVGPLVEATARGDSFDIVVTDDDPGEDIAAAMSRVVAVAAAQLDAGGALPAVREATEHLAVLRAATADAEAHWRATIRAALDDHERVVDVAATAGISRERVYQIRDGRRT
jgi:hypothetical protein